MWDTKIIILQEIGHEEIYWKVKHLQMVYLPNLVLVQSNKNLKRPNNKISEDLSQNRVNSKKNHYK